MLHFVSIVARIEQIDDVLRHLGSTVNVYNQVARIIINSVMIIGFLFDCEHKTLIHAVQTLTWYAPWRFSSRASVSACLRVSNDEHAPLSKAVAIYETFQSWPGSAGVNTRQSQRRSAQQFSMCVLSKGPGFHAIRVWLCLFWLCPHLQYFIFISFGAADITARVLE